MGNLLPTAVMLFLTYLTPQVFAAQPQAVKDSLFLSVNLHLGMPEGPTINALADHYKVEKIKGTSENATSSSWILVSKNETAHGIDGGVSFRNGKLTQAYKSWTPGNADSTLELTDALLGVVEHFEGEHRNVCVIYHQYINTPGDRGYVITVRCGNKYILISANRGTHGNTADVTEFLESPDFFDSTQRRK